LGGVPQARPKLQLVSADYQPPPDEIYLRECRLRRIKWLVKAYELQWLIDQHCFGLKNVHVLDSPALQALHRDMERARECITEGIGFDEAGLVKEAPNAAMY